MLRLGLALSDDEVDYLVELFLQGAAQSDRRRADDVRASQFRTLPAQDLQRLVGNRRASPQRDAVRHDPRDAPAHPAGTVVAYSDNSSVIEGASVPLFHAAADGQYVWHEELTHILAKVETHNHPTAISPFPGRGDRFRRRDSRRRRDRPRLETESRPVRFLGLQPQHPRCACSPGKPNRPHYGRPARIASPLAIMLEGPIGAAAFNNEFGRPNLAGYFRTYEQFTGSAESPEARLLRGYHKPIMIAGGVGSIAASQSFKAATLPAGTLLIQLGGPGMLIGLGGGAASSMTTGSNTADLDFASVQRGNPEIQRRAQEVIDRCWQMGAPAGDGSAAGDGNPILSVHDVGAGGISNALPELAHGAGCGARFELRAMNIEEPGMSPAEIWCNEAQERYVMAIAPDRLSRIHGALRARALPLRGRRRDHQRQAPARHRQPLRQPAGRYGHGRAARQAATDDPHAPPICRRQRVPFDATASNCAKRPAASCACRRWPTRRS
jgi:phosphoribosylformylglycinamidine synthase